MKHLLVLLFVSWTCVASAEEKFSMTFDRVPLSQLVLTFYDQCEKRGVVLDPGVKQLDEPYTLKTPDMSCSSLRALLADLLARAGIELVKANGYDATRATGPKDDREGWQEVIYRPSFRDPVELADMALIAVRKGMFAHQRRTGVVQQVGSAGTTGVQPADNGSNGASITGKAVDKLVFFGPSDEAKAVSALLSRLDVPSPQVEISVGIYEFQSGASVGSAVSAAVSLFGKRLGITVDGGGAGGGSSLKISLPSLDAALSLLDQDSRFKYVARPKVLAKDGEQVSFQAGQDVRVAGSVSVDRNGNPVQSIVTMNAGVTLQAIPLIRGEVVDLALHQVVSDFVTSPNREPSVVKRDLSTRLLLQPGFVYVVGGLQTTRSTGGRHRFFGFEIGSSSDSSQSEIVLLLSVSKDTLVTVPGR